MTELWQRSAVELADGFREGSFSASEIVDAHLMRIDEVNGSVNAVVRRFDDEARSVAGAIDDARAAGRPLGPLAGVPFTIKENIDLAGHPTTEGVAALADAVPEVDAPVVERLRDAGAIPLARTNLPDFGLRLHTDNALHGLTRNPWNPDHTTAGSSGGEAAALASGMSPLGLGNDLGGSLRNPASACSIASIKPTLGRVPGAATVSPAPATIMMQLLAVEGPMARTVGDVRAALEVLSGAHPRDPRTVPVPLEQATGHRRVALVDDPPGGTTDRRVSAATRAAANALDEAGVEVELVDVPDYEAVLQCWRTLVIGDIAAGLELLGTVVSPDALAFLLAAAELGGPPDAAAVAEAWTVRMALQQSWNDFFARFDAVLTPTWTQLPFRHGFDIDGPDAAGATLDLIRPVLPANVLGLPSAAVPAGLVDGLPVGVLLTGAPWSELLLLDLAERIETAGLAPATPIDPKPAT